MSMRHGDPTEDVRRSVAHRPATSPEPAPPRTPPPGHPLADLQRGAGNAAVVQLLKIQRHALVPEEEAGS